MQVLIGEPYSPRPYRPKQASKWSDLVIALRDNPLGWWVNMDLSAATGLTLVTKQTSATRALRRALKQPIHSQIEGGRLFVRIVPDPMLPAMAQPIDWTKRRHPAFFRPRACVREACDSREGTMTTEVAAHLNARLAGLPGGDVAMESGSSLKPLIPEGTEQRRRGPLPLGLLKRSDDRQSSQSAKDEQSDQCGSKCYRQRTITNA
jgi:hypothetical protein